MRQPNSPLSPEVPDEFQLLERLREKDETAFEILLDRYHSGMVNIALIYLNERTVAEKEALLQIFRNWKTN